MYTLVLMASLSTAPDVPQFNGYFRDLFGGCHGSARESDRAGNCHSSCHGLFGIRDYFRSLGCRGSCMGTCHGSGSCHGSCQGSCHGGCNGSRDAGIDRAYVRAGSGCNGGCMGGSCMGGGCMGGYAMAPASCFGSVSYGQCFSSLPIGGFNPGAAVTPTVPGLGGGYAQPQVVDYGMLPNPSPAGGCCDGLTAVSPVVVAPTLGVDMMPADYPTITPPNVPASPPRNMPGIEVEREKSNTTQRNKVSLSSDDSSRGNVVVKLPVDAKLYVEGRPLSVTNGERTFVTPPLPADRDALYAFKMEYTHAGDTHAVTKTVRMRAGVTTLVEFADPRTPDRQVGRAPTPAEQPELPRLEVPSSAGFKARATAKPSTPDVPTVAAPFPQDQAKITVHLPPGAMLFVNGAKNDRTELVREFVTPKLTAGKKYQYTMRTQMLRNGLPETQEQVVDFRPGDVLTVDFTKRPAGESVASR